MAPLLNSRSPIRARSEGLSPGAIAGVVVGSVIGGSLVLIVLGFLYFRHRRMVRQAQAEEPPPIPKASVEQQSTSFPWQHPPSGQTPTAQPGHLPSLEGRNLDRGAPVLGDDSAQRSSPTSAQADNWVGAEEGFYPHQPQRDGSLPPDVDFSMPRQPTIPLPAGQEGTTPMNYEPTSAAAANSSYYDMRISMDSEPAVAIPPSRQMSEMYKAQIKEAEEHRKRSGSFPRRLLNSLMGKRSTQSSSQGQGTANSSTSHQYFPTSPVESPISMRPETGSELPQGAPWQSGTAEGRYCEEPGEIPADTETPFIPNTQPPAPAFKLGRGSDIQRKDSRHTNDSQTGLFASQGSFSAIRPSTERDPELPSAALRPGPTYGLPHEAQPKSPVQRQEVERLKSPDIPEPMEIDPNRPETQDHSPYRASHSPRLATETFVNPMAVLKPTNAVEQAAYTDYQMENAASPPAMPHSPPEVAANQSAPGQSVAGQPADDFSYGDQFLELPDDDEPRQSGESFDYSTTPGHSTDPSSGRTPDTRITASPSPYPTIAEHIKPEHGTSTSPEPPRPSPISPSLICEDCGRHFDQIHKLNHHKRYHDRKHSCPYQGCDKKFGTKTHLDRHINDKHVKSKAYHCTDPSCPYFKGRKAFPRKDNWRRHMTKKHAVGAQELEAMDESHG
ncbi:hypothetical protein F4780DRAFT_396909 [Xylariomycetidae sp. FL0641]|nr:hypothetical protein F4780DRAFT_396909 [Xylariomycetidae sp. FL0641]